MATTSNMFMYSLTIQPPTVIHQAILGQFAGTKEQFILAASGSRLVLHRPDPNLGRIYTVLSHEVFGIIRAIAAFRLAGGSKDYIILSSDAGRVAILEYQPAQNRFHRIHLETFGKSGVRRVIPGQFLAADPKGRACLLASVEKNKIVYVLNRNSQAELTISSPLEAHKPGTLVLSMVALDVGYSNPVFAALEIDCSEADLESSAISAAEVETQLVYYELDLGLNHVVRKWHDPVDPTSSMLFQIPGGNDEPSGVLVCGEENITYRHSNQDAFRVPIPRRRGPLEDPERKRSIVCGVMHKLKGNAGAFFFLLQTEDGDLFKVTIDMVEDENGKSTGEVRRLKIKYFDTVPVATSLCILKSGFLFVACEAGNHLFYQFEKLGDDDDEVEFTSDDYPADCKLSYVPAYFYIRPLENLVLVENIASLNPQLRSKIVNIRSDEEVPQIFSICGGGARSSFRMLKYGLDTNEIVSSELPGVPSAVWTTKLCRGDQYDAYIVLSFTNGTLVLSIGETVEEVSDTGFLSTVPTLAVQQIGDEGLVQVHPKGIRHMMNGRVTEWATPQHRSVVAAATNNRQVVLGLSSGEIVYFELDNGDLAEYQEKREMPGTITALSLGDVPEGRLRSSFLAVGCDNCTVRILSLDPDSVLESLSVQSLTAAPSALHIMPLNDATSGGKTLYLHIGLHSGVYIRTVLEEPTGELSDTRLKFLGPKAVRLFQVPVQGQTCVLALSSRTWLGYTDPFTRSFTMAPLNYADLEWGWNFSSEQCDEGMVGVHGKNLRIFAIDQLVDTLIKRTAQLTYTPKDFAKHPKEPYFYTIESDNNTLAPELRNKLLSDPELTQENALAPPPEDFGHPRGRGRWASCISVVNASSDDLGVLQTVDLTENEAATSVCVVSFAGQDDEPFLIVGTGKDMILSPRQFTCGYIHVYRFKDGGQTIEFIHKTKVEAPPMAMIPFQGRLLVGIGVTLRIYDLGLRQLLRKAQADVAPQIIVSLDTQGSRIIVGDVQQSITYVVFKPETNKLIAFADDVIARWTTCATMVDYESVAAGDKFGNIWIVRCPEKASAESDAESTGMHLIHARGYLHGTPHRVSLMAHVFTQDIPTSITKTNLVAGGQEILVWSGLQGTIGALIPLQSREDADFFSELESHLRKESPPLGGRDHLIYRGYYVPVKGVIDGDLCEMYNLLPKDKKAEIAGELDRSVREIERKISDLRSRNAF